MSVKLSVFDEFERSPDNPGDGYGCEEVVPRGHVSLIDLYENNFIRFRKLVADLHSIRTMGTSHLAGCQSVYLRVIERSRYTTTVRMTYLFHNDDGDAVSEPDLKLRIYHDARLIEVVAGHLRHGQQCHDRLPASALGPKWRLNRFLYKWLGYCLYLGHRVIPEEAASPAEA